MFVLPFPALLRRPVPLTLLALLVALPSVADGGRFEIYGGFNFPDSEGLDDEATYGLRGAWELNDELELQLSVGRYDFSERQTLELPPLPIPFPIPIPREIEIETEIELTFVDLSAVWYPRREGFYLYGGPGWAFAESEIAVRTPIFIADVDVSVDETASDDSFSAHLGAGWEIRLSGAWSLRPDLKARWLEEADGVDLEPTVSLSYRFGG